MQRSARAVVNPAVELAIARAEKLRVPLFVCFCINPNYPSANERSFYFLAEGLVDAALSLRARGIRMVLLQGNPVVAVPAFCRAVNATELVMDRAYQRNLLAWRKQVRRRLNGSCVIWECEGDVAVPVDMASKSLEPTAASLRPKLARGLRQVMPEGWLPCHEHVHPQSVTSWTEDLPSHHAAARSGKHSPSTLLAGSQWVCSSVDWTKYEAYLRESVVECLPSALGAPSTVPQCSMAAATAPASGQQSQYQIATSSSTTRVSRDSKEVPLAASLTFSDMGPVASPSPPADELAGSPLALRLRHEDDSRATASDMLCCLWHHSSHLPTNQTNQIQMHAAIGLTHERSSSEGRTGPAESNVESSSAAEAGLLARSDDAAEAGLLARSGDASSVEGLGTSDQHGIIRSISIAGDTASSAAGVRPTHPANPMPWLQWDWAEWEKVVEVVMAWIRPQVDCDVPAVKHAFRGGYRHGRAWLRAFLFAPSSRRMHDVTPGYEMDDPSYDYALSASLSTTQQRGRGLAGYASHRNDPGEGHTSNISPYLHFGHLTPLEILPALRQVLAQAEGRKRGASNSSGRDKGEVDGTSMSTSKEARQENRQGKVLYAPLPGASKVLQSSSAPALVSAASTYDCDKWLQEVFVWREKSVNLVARAPGLYDRYDALPRWARETLDAHAYDERPRLYTFEQLEKAQTDDVYWNAAQRELVATGRMHGRMRMYWMKLLLMWTPDPQTAFQWGIALNDRWYLDGRDPNGYAGILWCLGLSDDQGKGQSRFADRRVTGTVRMMTQGGLRAKYGRGLEVYVRRVDSAVAAAKVADRRYIELLPGRTTDGNRAGVAAATPSPSSTHAKRVRATGGGRSDGGNVGMMLHLAFRAQYEQKQGNHGSRDMFASGVHSGDCAPASVMASSSEVQVGTPGAAESADIASAGDEIYYLGNKRRRIPLDGTTGGTSSSRDLDKAAGLSAHAHGACGRARAKSYAKTASKPLDAWLHRASKSKGGRIQ